MPGSSRKQQLDVPPNSQQVLEALERQAATYIFGECRWVGQLFGPHGTQDERWPAVEDAAASLMWHLTGAVPGQLGTIKKYMFRCA